MKKEKELNKEIKITSWGKWENPRINMLNSIVKDKRIIINDKQTGLPILNLDKKKEVINHVLLTTVNTAISKASKAYTTANIERWKINKTEKKAMLTEIYNYSLTMILPTLSTEMDVNKKLLKPHVQHCILEAKTINKSLLDSLIHIGDRSLSNKVALAEEKYGPEFVKKFGKNLLRELLVNDPELINFSAKDIIKFIRNNFMNSPQTRSILLKHADYIKEVAIRNVTLGSLTKKFKEMTGMTMEEYKKNFEIIAKAEQAKKKMHKNLLSKGGIFLAKINKYTSNTTIENDLNTNTPINSV